VEWGGQGIRLNAVAPGMIETPMLERLLADETQSAPLRALSIPLGRTAPPEEIASCVAFLLGPDAAYVHGHLLIADGGAHALMDPEKI
jgi:NAD(P)-dependent dehydrogenase (short-subunit alcohol dehydrogenase family)